MMVMTMIEMIMKIIAMMIMIIIVLIVLLPLVVAVLLLLLLLLLIRIIVVIIMIIRICKLQRSGGKSPLTTLYNCLIGPMEETLASLTEGATEPVDLVLVLQGDLYLIPFLMLRNDASQPFLFERFNVIIVPSVSALTAAAKVSCCVFTWADMHHKVVGNFGSEADVRSLYYRSFRVNETSDVGACTHGRSTK